MSAVSGSPAAAPSLRRLPFTVCIAPSFANPLLTAPASDPASTAVKSGLLFGVRDSASVVVKRTSAFDLRSSTNGGGKAIEAAVAAANADSELRTMSLIGWYVQRSTGGLLESDVEIHNRSFLKVSDLAVVIRPEGASEIVCEIYSRSIEGLLSEEGHRWGLLRLTRQKLLEESAEVTMRAQMRDDFFMRAYSQPYDTGDNAGPALWRRTLHRFRRGSKDQDRSEQGTKDKGIEVAVSPGLLNPERPDRDQAAPVPVKIDPATDVTREMPRELALKALGLDSNVSDTAPPRVQAQEKILTEAPVAVTVPLPEIAPRQEVALRRELSPVTAEPPPDQRERRRTPMWITAAATFGIAAAGTFAVVHYHLLPNSVVSSTSAPSALGLRLEGQGDRILITWDRKGASALTAVSGQLAIDDGAQHKTLTLDPSQIVNGSVLYRPNSADITFHLQLMSSNGQETEETLRVLDASRTNNDGIKVMTADGVAEPLPKALPKATMPRKIAAALPPGRAVVATDSEADTKITAPPTSELPPQPSAQKEAVVPGETQSPASGANPTTTSNQQPAEAPSETVVAPPPPAKETVKVLETPASAEPLVPVPAAKAVETSPAPSNPLRNYRAPQPARQVMPNLRVLPPGLTSTDAKVEVTVNIDTQGHVTLARITNTTSKISSALSGALLGAARAWTFNPATMNGRAVDSEHAIVFNFKAAPR